MEVAPKKELIRLRGGPGVVDISEWNYEQLKKLQDSTPDLGNVTCSVGTYGLNGLYLESRSTHGRWVSIGRKRATTFFG